MNHKRVDNEAVLHTDRHTILTAQRKKGKRCVGHLGNTIKKINTRSACRERDLRE
jgi:hypothetical protein